jgi:isochorismate pyruvate lyase
MFDSLPDPASCRDLQEVRLAIDTIDLAIVQALGRRAHYVQAAARFKRDEAAVRDDERLRRMLAQRRAWAAEAGINPDLIERLFHQVVDYFVREEGRHWREQRAADAHPG